VFFKKLSPPPLYVHHALICFVKSLREEYHLSGGWEEEPFVILEFDDLVRRCCKVGPLV
jgi:hypothetical protein